MGNEQEIERLRADLEVFERYELNGCGWLAIQTREKIAAIEAAAADPWRKAKSAVEYFRGFAEHKVAEHDVVAYVDHLTAENARLEKGVAEFRHGLACMVSTYGKIDERSEIAVKHARKLIECEGEEIDVSFDVKDIADTQPPFEGPDKRVVPLKPRDFSHEFDELADDEPRRLDPARVLATAVELGWGPTVYAEMTLLRDAKPYRLKGAGDE